MSMFEDFHVVAQKETSHDLAELLRASGIRIQQRVIQEIGRPEFVIAVHVDDLERATEISNRGISGQRTFFSRGKADPGSSNEQTKSEG